MNLHGIVSPMIGIVNPSIMIEIQRSTGYTVAEDGTQVPSYETVKTLAQIQSAGSNDLRQAEMMNIQGDKQVVYLNGNWQGAIRVGQIGGDVLKFYGQAWLATMVMESWPDWTKLMVVLQNGA